MAEKKVYRICTEDVNRETIIDLVAIHFGCFNVLTGHGYWQGIAEQSLTVEIITDLATAREAIYGIASKIRDYNKQDAVLVTVQTIESELI